jgi:hypothetical protein
MATSKTSARAPKRSRATAPSKKKSGDSGSETGVSSMISAGLASSFDVIREKLSASISTNGEEYLHEAVDKITSATAEVVTWCKKNPIKMVVGVAALTAVSAFLVHTMGANGPSVKRVIAKVAKGGASG